MTERIAIYAAPSPSGALWRFGSGAIGYDAQTGAEATIPNLPADPETWAAWTSDPRRYGFHATLKAPFRLAEGRGPEEAAACAHDLAARLAPVRLDRLVVRAMGSFVALVPAVPSPELDALAAACVRGFEPLRAPLTAAERERRLAAKLTLRQAQLVEQYGYPYVLEQFRFHMTLTGRLPADRIDAVRGRLAELYEAIEPGLAIDDLCLFHQADPQERFTIRERVPLAG